MRADLGTTELATRGQGVGHARWFTCRKDWNPAMWQSPLD